MDEEAQNNCQAYIITHSKCGWVMQPYDEIPEEGTKIVRCPNCGQLLKTTEVILEPSNDGQSENEVPVISVQEPAENMSGTGTDSQPEKPRKKQRIRKQAAKEQPSHTD